MTKGYELQNLIEI